MSDASGLSSKLDLVSHDVRAGILVALARHQREHAPDSTLGFAELRRRVGHDDPGNFNYHLKRLRGTLVVKAEGGYRLSSVGHHFVAVLLSDRFDPDRTLSFPDVELSCLLCGETATAAYEDGLLETRCQAGHELRLNVGPELLERTSVDEALQVGLRRSLLEVKSIVDGVCPYCEGETTGALERASLDPEPVQYAGYCERCGTTVRSTAGGCVLFHPAVVSFCHDRGRNVYQHTWDIVTDHVGTARLTGEDPLRAEVSAAIDGEELAVALDRSAAVLSVERVS